MRIFPRRGCDEIEQSPDILGKAHRLKELNESCYGGNLDHTTQRKLPAMEKFIPYEEPSKKKKREPDARGRTVWTVRAATRRSENPKAYNRKKAQKRTDDPSFCAFFFCCHSTEKGFMNHSASAVAGHSPGKLVHNTDLHIWYFIVFPAAHAAAEKQDK